VDLVMPSRPSRDRLIGPTRRQSDTARNRKTGVVATACKASGGEIGQLEKGGRARTLPERLRRALAKADENRSADSAADRYTGLSGGPAVIELIAL